MKILLFTVLAGMLGTLLRFFCTKWIGRFCPGFPAGTLFVNVTGAFAAGFLFLYLKGKFPQYEAYFPIVFLGFLGAFTTFSTFALESSRFLAEAQYAKFAVNVLLQNASGILFCCIGMASAKLLLK